MLKYIIGVFIGYLGHHVLYIGIATGHGRVSLSHTHPKEKFILILMPKLNRYEIFVSSLSVLGNGYTLVLVPVPMTIFLLFQYQLIFTK